MRWVNYLHYKPKTGQFVQGEHYGNKYHTTRIIDFIARWCTTKLAIQRELGLWTKRHYRHNFSYFAYFVPARPHIKRFQ